MRDSSSSGQKVKPTDIYADVMETQVRLRIGAAPPVDCDHWLHRKDTQRSLRKLLSENNEEEYGKMLWRNLFGGGVIVAYQEAIKSARDRKACVRFRLVVPATPLALESIWWEALYDENNCQKLACAQDIALSRFYPTRMRGSRRAAEGKLKTLIIVSNPPGLGDGKWQHYPPIYGPGEEHGYLAGLEQLLNDAALADRMGWSIEPRATYDRILQRLSKDRYDILHIVAHGNPEGLILENDTTQEPTPISANQMWTLISPSSSVRLVVLMACNSAAPASDHPFLNLAQSMVKAGVPSVVAFRDLVNFETSKLFVQTFYQSLGDCLFWGSGTVDAAVNAARFRLTTPHVQDSWAWAKPVLYMSGDGKLFEPPHTRRPAGGREGRYIAGGVALPSKIAAQDLPLSRSAQPISYKVEPIGQWLLKAEEPDVRGIAPGAQGSTPFEPQGTPIRPMGQALQAWGGRLSGATAESRSVAGLVAGGSAASALKSGLGAVRADQVQFPRSRLR